MKKSILFLLPILVLGLAQSNIIDAATKKIDMENVHRFKGLINDPSKYSEFNKEQLAHELRAVKAKMAKYEEYLKYYSVRFDDLKAREAALTSMGVKPAKKAVTKKKKAVTEKKEKMKPKEEKAEKKSKKETKKAGDAAKKQADK